MNYRKHTKHNKKVGAYGEMLAKNYLINKGYFIIDQNIQISRQEIDILAKIKENYVFVEVKTRASSTYGTADDAIGKKKLENLKKGIFKYIERNDININFVRIDLIAIDINKNIKIANIKHYKDII